MEEQIELFDIIEFKKPHPCISKSKQFQVIRLGADMKVKCLGCGRVIMLSREDFNLRLKRLLEHKPETL